MPFIMAAHGAYVATANIAFPLGFIEKVKKGLAFEGPSYIQVYVSCPTGWKFLNNMSIEIGKLAFQSNIAPLYEIEKGILTISKKPANKVPVKDYLKTQGRFKHMTEEEIKDVQDYTDDQWQRLLDLEKNKTRLF